MARCRRNSWNTTNCGQRRHRAYHHRKCCIDFPFASTAPPNCASITINIFRLFKLTETLHKHGACVSIRLNHAGASAYAYRLEGQTPLSSSTTPSKKHGNIPRPMTHEEIYHAVEKFGDAAELVRRAGLTASNSCRSLYLISSFYRRCLISALMNLAAASKIALGY